MRGLVSHMVGVAGILGYYLSSITSGMNEGRVDLSLTLKAIGKVGVWIGDLPSKTIDDHIMVEVFGTPVPREAVSVSAESEYVLEIDLGLVYREDERLGARCLSEGNDLTMHVSISP